MYLLEWGSSLLLSDMMEFIAFRIRAYLVKDRRADRTGSTTWGGHMHQTRDAAAEG